MVLSVPSLLDCWHVRDLPRFRRRHAQKARSPASSLGAGSHTGLAPGPCAPAEVNRRDALGRTVLHLLASSDETEGGEYLAALLTHPSVNVNVQDHESGYTALHRALYAGHLHTAITLLRRPDTDVRVRDHEGLTPLDLYNLTVPGTSPACADAAHGGELFVWGANRNFTLGLGHADDGTRPERAALPAPRAAPRDVPGACFDRVRVRDVGMSRWHTVVLSAQEGANVYVCGIGTHGRLGRLPSAQPALQALPDWHEHAVAVAVGPDHTVLVTRGGAVYTYGANRMAQLGYTVEEGLGTVASSSGTVRAGKAPAPGASIGARHTELDVQVTPRRVLGVLKREQVLGAAASRLHTAVYTAEGVYTWGTNTGQLGYDRHAAPVQVQPRRVTAVSQPVVQVAASEFATACLLASWDVVVLHGDAHFRIAFPVPRPLSDHAVFRPRHTHPKPTIAHLTCCGTTFAARSHAGDVFTFALEHPAGSGAKPAPPRPQLVWSVRRKFAAVRDVSLGPDGALALCTASGHVYVRGPRTETKGRAARAHKFAPVPYLQRAVRVFTNETGSFAALAAPVRLRAIAVRGAGLGAELRALLPHLGTVERAPSTPSVHSAASDAEPEASDASEASDDEVEVPSHATAQALALLRAADTWRTRLTHAWPEAAAATGCDAALVVEDGAVWVPAHRTLLLATVPAVQRQGNGARDVYIDAPEARAADGAAPCATAAAFRLHLPHASLRAALFLLAFLYTGSVPPVWTAHLLATVVPVYGAVDADALRTELRALATALGLRELAGALSTHVWRPPPPPLAPVSDALYTCVTTHDAACTCTHAPRDVVLHLADREVACHAVFLRRSPMLAALFEWRRTRGDRGIAHVDLRTQRWEVVRIGLHYLYTDAHLGIFRGTDVGHSVDQFLDLVLDVLQFADELLLTRLQSLCLVLLRARLKATNVAALLADARRLNAPALAEVCMEYITRNLETLLESGFLDDLPRADMHALEAHVQHRQDVHGHRTIASDRVLALLLKHQAYVETLDLPKPSLGLACLKVPRRAKTSPALLPADRRTPEPARAPPTPTHAPSAPGDDSLLFAMDDVHEPPAAWQTVGKPRARAAQTPRKSPALVPSDASPDASRRTPPAASPLAATPPSGVYVPPAQRAARPVQPTDILRAAGPPSVSLETQEALARLPVTARVSQKERKKQRAPEPAPSAPTPAWGRASRATPSPASITVPAASSSRAPRASPSALGTRPESWRPSPSGASPQWGAGAASPPAPYVSPPTLSFAQIQQQQQTEGLRARVAMQTPTSFAQIQHEERLAAERRRQEQQEAEAFERWFEEESRRVQQEQQRAERAARGGRTDRGRRGRRGGHAGRGNTRGGKAPDPATARIDDV
ncbi:hypothetical protein MBRA1_001997 [Malassezia brasiliensis]|uniref:BTB domain-containing protein n=1 Tax=Malassezia brasiliensis TaxID=1821822 RepID=A0AAF0DXC0_9BASI|nr:hypothetical protein MBRA1_001997 [Malassezia brasiliensis]